jgi:hypothetical protein
MKIDNNSNPVTNNEFKEGAIKYVESILIYILYDRKLFKDKTYYNMLG